MQKEALLRRITDVYSGAQGAVWSSDDFATAAILEKVVHVFKGMFKEGADYSYMWDCYCLSHYDTPESACEFLFRAGIRA